ncbi:preprotein translocase subunit SecE [Actinomyces howellii]|uniref:Protein translocase subunit SecE n=1 Tax=Actinomyces howellii TaxID=52771 RepID=A0A3S4V4C3_9ACTO|nr:preprotein translocase subunit SecE [Actinomyces howellii]VEG27761.1 Preprotein translocase subunit secE [Actinomyces howellii]
MSASAVDKQDRKRAFPVRVLLFFRQVVEELRKVVWPTRKELSTYFVVVVVFILAIMAFTGLLDAAFDWLIMRVFA